MKGCMLPVVGMVVAILLCDRPLSSQEVSSQHALKRDLYGDPLPPGATARLGTIRYRAGSDWHIHTAFLPDTTTLITATEDNRIAFWAAESGGLLREVRVEPMQLRAFALSQNGQRMAAAGYWYTEDKTEVLGQVRILDVPTGQIIRNIRRESRDVNSPSLAFTPNGKQLVSFGDHGLLRIDDIASGDEILTHQFPRGGSTYLTISPDGEWIAVVVGSNTQQFALWKWQAGEEPKPLKAPGINGADGRLAFSPDSRHVAWAGNYRDPGYVWSVADGALVARLVNPVADEYFTGGIAFTPDGKELLVATSLNEKGSLHAWDASNWKYVRKLDIAAGRFSLSPDGRLLATGNRVYELASGKDLTANPAAHRGRIGQVLALADGTIVTGSDDATVRSWDVETSRQKHVFTHDKWVRGIAVSPDGAKLASSSLDDTVRLWDLTSGKEIYRLAGHGRLGGWRSLAFTPDGKRLRSFGDDFYLRSWDVATGKAVLEHKIRPTGVKVPEGDDGFLRDDFMDFEGSIFSPDGQVMVLFANGKFFVFGILSARELQSFPHETGHVLSQTFAPDSQHFLTTAWGKPIQIKMADGRVLFGHEDHHPATLWDLSTGKPDRTILVPGGSIGPAAISADGLCLAVSSRKPNHYVAIYNLAGKRQQLIENIPSQVSALAFSRNGRALITGLDDSTALVWELPAPADNGAPANSNATKPEGARP